MDCGNLKQALSELKAMLNTPIKCHSPCPSSAAVPQGEGSPSGTTTEGGDTSSHGGSPGGEGDSLVDGDLPGQITRVLGKCEYQHTIMYVLPTYLTFLVADILFPPAQ